MKNFFTTILLIGILLTTGFSAKAQCNAPVIFSEPTSYSGVCDGVNFFCFANGDNLVYQWQIFSGSGFVNLTNVAPYSGTSAEVLDIYQPPYSLNGSQFRCVVSGSCGPNDTSDVVTVGIVAPIVITANTTAQTTCEGNTAVFSVQATGTIGAVWEEAPSPSGPWTQLADGGVYSGVFTRTLTITGATSSMNGNYYRCGMQTVCFFSGDVYSDPALLTVTAPCNAVNVWLGNTSQWINTSNWSLGAYPNSCSADVLIPTAPVGGNMPIVGPVVPQIGNLTIQNGATFTVGVAVTICGNVTGGTTTKASIIGNGVVVLQGTNTQDVNGKMSFNRVRSDNNSVNGININGDVEIVNSWVMKDGDIWNNGSVTLKSNLTGTAYMDFFTYAVGGIYTGSLTVEKYVASSATGYRDISLPVSTTVSELANDFNVVGQNGVNCWYAYSPYPTLQEYREDANAETDNYYGGFWSFTSATNYFEAGKGYAARIYNAPLTLSATGNMNYGMQLVQVTNTPSSIPAADGWNLIGNPYPAPIKWSSLNAMNPGKTDGSCYRFSTTGEYAGSWSVHNGTTGVPLGTTDEISTFQGFFVHAPANDYLFMDNSICTGGNSVVFYKTEDLADEVRLQLTNGTSADEIVAYTDVNATSNYDAGQDAVKIPAGGSVNMSFTSAGKEYAINVLNEITAQTELPLTISVTDSGSYTFNAVGLNLTSLTAYLKDAQTNMLYDLSATSPVLNLNSGQTYTGRFSVVFQTNTVLSLEETTETPAKIYAVGNEVFVTRISSTPAHISIVNVLGQQVVSENISGTNAALSLSSLGGQYVFVKLTEGSKVTIAKVLITNKK
jgi:hypothetical protein